MADEETQDQQADDTTDEQSTTDQAGGDEGTGVEGDEAAEENASDGDDAGDEDSGDDDGDDDGSAPLISQERFDSLKNDPEKLNKALHAAATKKFQKIAETRKQLEPYADFITEYERDPRQAAIDLVESLGIEVKKPKSVEQSEKVVAALSDQINAKVREALGDEYEDVADKLGKAIHDAASLMVEEAVKPLKETQNALISDSAAREASTALEAFAKRHPDWKKYDAQMTALSRKFKPGEGVTEHEYLDTLYNLASAGGKEGDAVKRAAKRMNASAKKSSSNRSVPANTVVKSSGGKLPTFGDAAAAARRGERLD